MTTDVFQTRHDDLQQRLITTRERIRQAEAQLGDLQQAEQQLLGAITVVREFIQLSQSDQTQAPEPSV